jgi:hypothetical protein
VKVFQAFWLCLLPLAVSAGFAEAQERLGSGDNIGSMRSTFYLGAGSANSEDGFDNDSTPFSGGFLHQVDGSKLIFGFDIGREGTMLDSTWGMNHEPRPAMSLNVLFGGNVVDSRRFKADAALLIGIREATSDCAASYLGYQCYAGATPDTEYKGNYGGVVTVSFDHLTVGLRATGESTQVLAGVRF